ncbi:MAG: OmpH family outer membrane protein [Bacteroidota bacterium]
MKKAIQFIAIMLLVVSTTTIFAQTKGKLGHIDSNELLKLMPGRDSALAKYQDYGKTLETTLSTMKNEFDTKYKDFTDNQATMSELIQKTKTKELQDLQGRIEDFKASAQKSLSEKENELLSPIINKAKKAIEEVAKENGFSYVFDTGSGVFLYSDGEDLMSLVKKKLNIK